jgi:hypothetical protein
MSRHFWCPMGICIRRRNFGHSVPAFPQAMNDGARPIHGDHDLLIPTVVIVMDLASPPRTKP